MMDIGATQSRDFIGDTIGDDTILINLKTGAYYSLTAVAGAVWAKTLVADFDFSEAQRDVFFVMLEEGIFDSSSAPAKGEASDTSIAFLKYTEMQELLLADPIHEVDEDGWPKLQ